MNTKIRKVGNSYAVTIPKGLADELALEEGTEVVVLREDETIVIKPARSRWDVLVDELRAGVREKGLTEADADEAVRGIRGRD